MAVGEWVKGQYTGDKRKYKHELNDQADHLATHAHSLLPREFQTMNDSPPPPGYRIRLKNARGLITSKFSKMISIAHHEQPLIFSYIEDD
jgi:hypothetical protein